VLKYVYLQVTLTLVIISIKKLFTDNDKSDSNSAVLCLHMDQFF